MVTREKIFTEICESLNQFDVEQFVVVNFNTEAATDIMRRLVKCGALGPELSPDRAED
jgi:hypothetical protein